MSYLIDTNVISEVRKRDRCDPNVARWFATVKDRELYLSALTLGEIRKGIELARRRDDHKAAALEAWLEAISDAHGERILGIDEHVADEWGRLNVPDPLPIIDGLLAATAKVHGLTLVTRNVADVSRSGARLLDPFEPAPNSGGA